MRWSTHNVPMAGVLVLPKLIRTLKLICHYDSRLLATGLLLGLIMSLQFMLSMYNEEQNCHYTNWKKWGV
jgi:hypothetical protein